MYQVHKQKYCHNSPLCKVTSCYQFQWNTFSIYLHCKWIHLCICKIEIYLTNLKCYLSFVLDLALILTFCYRRGPEVSDVHPFLFKMVPFSASVSRELLFFYIYNALKKYIYIVCVLTNKTTYLVLKLFDNNGLFILL